MLIYGRALKHNCITVLNILISYILIRFGNKGTEDNRKTKELDRLRLNINVHALRAIYSQHSRPTIKIFTLTDRWCTLLFPGLLFNAQFSTNFKPQTNFGQNLVKFDNFFVATCQLSRQIALLFEIITSRPGLWRKRLSRNAISYFMAAVEWYYCNSE